MEGSHQVQTDIGIAAEAETILILVHRYKLGDDVDARVEQIACHVGVVRADVVLLRMAVAELPARGKIELNDPHVGWQPVLLAIQVKLRDPGGHRGPVQRRVRENAARGGSCPAA